MLPSDPVVSDSISNPLVAGPADPASVKLMMKPSRPRWLIKAKANFMTPIRRRTLRFASAKWNLSRCCDLVPRSRLRFARHYGCVV
jgi:hypothetical protein